MDVVSNTSVISVSQKKYVSMLQELLTRYCVPFGKTANFEQLVPKLMRNDELRIEFSMLVQWIQRQEEGHLTLNQMLAILWTAMTGSKGDGFRSHNSGPLVILLSGLGGWPETEAKRETIVESAATHRVSEPVAQFEPLTSVAPKDEKRKVDDTADTWAAAVRRRRLMAALWLLPVLPPLMLCVVLYRDYYGRRVITPGPALTSVSPAVDEILKSGRGGRSSRTGSHKQSDQEGGGERPTSELGAPRGAAWPTSGVVVIGENGQIIRFDRTGLIQPLATAKIHTQKPEPAPVMVEGGLRMPAVVPEAVVTMSYPTVVTRETRAPAPEAVRPGITGTESRTSPTVMPVVVASATAPPIATAVAHPVADGSIPTKAVSPAQKFDLLHPKVSVSAGLLSVDIVKFQMPTYPKSARKLRQQGDVLVRVLISDKGRVVRAVALNGPQNLRDSVEKAVSRWRYVPYTENGKPMVVQTWVTFHFELRES